MFRASTKQNKGKTVRLSMDLSSGPKLAKKSSKEVGNAHKLAREAKKYSSRISIDCDGEQANAKSALDVMKLQANVGDVLTIEAHGSDADRAMSELSNFLKGSEVDEQLLFNDEQEGIFALLQEPIEDSPFERKLKGKD